MGRTSILREAASFPWKPVGLPALALVLAWAGSSSAFTIIAPAEDTVLEPGAVISATVDLGTERGMRRVSYLWYRQEEEPVPLQQAEPALVATAASSPPYGGTLTVPVDAIGLMRLLAVGEVASGRLAGHQEFDEVLVRVEPIAPLQAVEFEVEKPWRLDTVGKLIELPVIGQFADGVARKLVGAAAGSVYETSDAAVVTVQPDGQVRIVGNGRARLTVTNRGRWGALEVIVKGDGSPNRIPVADAGEDMTVKGGAKVVLNGLRSRDPDGDPLRYEWVQVRGHKVSLLDQDAAKASFVAPRVSRKRLLRFKLRVTDMRGPDTVRGADSLPAYVNVWVVP